MPTIRRVLLNTRKVLWQNMGPHYKLQAQFNTNVRSIDTV